MRNRRSLPAALIAVVLLGLSGCDTIDSIFGGAGDEEKLPGKRVSVLVVEQKLKVDPTLANTPVVLPAAVETRDWPQIGGNATHNPGHLALSSDPHQTWSAEAGDGPEDNLHYTGTPVVADGKVFVLDTAAEVSALDAKTGAKLWRVRISPQDARTDTIGGGIAYGGGRIYATAGYPELLAIDPANGGMIWRKQLTAPPRASVAYSDDRVYIVTLDDQAEVLNAADGTQVWSHAGLPESEGVLGQATPAVDRTVAITPYSSGEIFALRIETGRVAWQDNLISIRHTNALWSLTDIATPPVIDRGQIFAVSEGGRFVSIDQRTGQRMWQHEVGANNMPWAAGDFVFLLDNNNELVCFSREKGAIRWIAQLQNYEDMEKRKTPVFWQGPVLAGGRLILVNSLGQIAFASPDDGHIISVIGASDAISVPPIVADGTLYVLTDDGNLNAYQ